MRLLCFSLLLRAHELQRLGLVTCDTGSGVLSMLESVALLPSDLASSRTGVTISTGVRERKKKKREKEIKAQHHQETKLN